MSPEVSRSGEIGVFPARLIVGRRRAPGPGPAHWCYCASGELPGSPRSAPWWSGRPGSRCWCCSLPGYRRPVADALTPVIAGLPDALRRSLTWDQGREMRCTRRSRWPRTARSTSATRSAVAAGQQREHQRAAPPVLPQGHRPGRARPGGPGRGRRRAERPAAQDPGLEDPGRGAGRDPGQRRRRACSAYRWRLAPPLIPGGEPRIVPGRPPASRRLRIASATALGAAWTPETTAAPGGRKSQARPRACPRHARHPRRPAAYG